jgi:ubiquinone/menaquinone biosynthesis C-methylase UbiE
MNYTPELAAKYSENREDFNETDRELFEALESVGIKDRTVLDLGCGDGRHAKRMRELGAARVVGMDVNPNMIQLATEKQNSDSEDLLFIVGDGKQIPLESESVDRIFSNFVIHYFSNSREVFSEIARVLKDHGYFVGTFNLTDVDEGFEYLINQEMPIRLGQGDESLVVQNLVKSRKEIEEALQKVSLKIIGEKELAHPNAVVDDSYPYKDHVHKHAVLFLLQKVSDEPIP